MISSCKIQNGKSVRFWCDLLDLSDLGVSKWRYRQHFFLLQGRKISLQQFFLLALLKGILGIPFPQSQAQLQWNELQNLIQYLDRTDLDHYEWSYIWGPPVYTSKKAYISLSGSFPASPLFKWIWKSSVQPKHKFFFCLLLGVDLIHGIC